MAFLLVLQSSSASFPVAASQPPASLGSACTPFADLRGSDVRSPASGDVATVSQLCLRGDSVRTLSRVPFSDKPGASISEIELARDASLHPLASIGAPGGSAVDIRSRNGNWTHLYGGAFWRAPAITASGEIQAVDRGHAEFSVAASLGYFAVVLPRFLARVKGTIFDVDYEPSSAAFSVREGTVAITRTSAIRLLDENRSIDGIRFTDTITAAGPSSIVYALPLHVERDFQNEAQAEQYLTAQLQQAIETRDPQAVDDALSNLQIVTGKTIAGFASVHGGGTAATTLARSILAAAVGGTVVALGAGGSARSAQSAAAVTPSPNGTPTPAPSHTPTATPAPTNSAPQPTPTPTPKPTATPSASATPTPTAKPTATATATATLAPTQAPTAAPSTVPTATSVPTPTPTPSPVSGGVIISDKHHETSPPSVPGRNR